MKRKNKKQTGKVQEVKKPEVELPKDIWRTYKYIKPINNGSYACVVCGNEKVNMPYNAIHITTGYWDGEQMTFEGRFKDCSCVQWRYIINKEGVK